MKITKENINITSYLIGIHSFRKDHNYGNYKTNLINDLQSLFDLNFESLKVGGIDILRVGLDDPIEIRLTPNTIVYQDVLEFDKVTLNAKEILKMWSKYSPNLKLSLIGLVTGFDINLAKPSNHHDYRLMKTYFKEFNIGNKLKGIELKLNYSVSIKTYDYNVHLTLIEKNEKEYGLQGSVDFNTTTENTISGLSQDCCDRTFNAAKDYFENDLFRFLNLEEK
jgi:hypothetical protein